jgi:16S rRNA C967 or C1407 C5-methylase (RsmB/RsmF family)
MLKYSIVILLLFTSCTAKKIVTQTKEVVVNDTIILTKDRIVTKAVNDTILIDSPCDSLGILKPFKQRLKTAQGEITIQSKNNVLEATINLDSIVQSIEKRYESKTVDTKEKSDTLKVKYKTPLWLVLSLVFSVIINVLLLRFKL